MKSFHEYLEEFTSREKYVAVIYDDATQEKLHDWCAENGITHKRKFGGERLKTKFEFHTTIFFTTSKHDIKNDVIIIEGSVNDTSIEMLGENSDIPTLSVRSDDIQGLREYYESLDFKDEWPEFKPHISLSYDRQVLDYSKMVVPNFKLFFDRIVIKDAES